MKLIHDHRRNACRGQHVSHQRQLLLDYEEDITKYAQGLDKGKIKIDLGDGFLHQGRTVAHTRGGKDNRQCHKVAHQTDRARWQIP